MDKVLIINKIIEHYKFNSDAEFARFLEITPQNLSNWKARNTYDAELIYTKCVDINPEWLLTGKGEMLKTKKNKNTGNLIPLYEDVATIGGSNMVADTGTSNNAPITIDSGDWFHGATAAIRHYGDSMVEYPSGCILAIRELFNKDEVVPGRKYVIETSEIRVTKKLICFDDDTFMCYSTNNETYPDGTLIHQPFKIRKKDIRHIAIVLGSVNKEESTGKVQLL